MATTHVVRDRDFQQGETTAARRKVVVEHASSGATFGTQALSKDGGAFADVSSNISISEIGSTGLYVVEFSADELDTEGPLVLHLDDSTDDVYVRGMRCVDHDPYLDETDLRQKTRAAL